MDRHLWLSLAIPAIFLLVTGIVKTLVRKRLQWANFYLGLDAALAALASGLVNIVDLVRDAERDNTLGSGEAFTDRIIWTISFIVVALLMLLVVMVIHQHWEAPEHEGEREQQRWSRGILLGIVSNLIGSGTLLLFIYIRLKGRL